MRILIITYYWPPGGGGGVQRWLKLSKYLRHFGIEPIIYTPKLKHYPHRDDSLSKDVPPELTIWRRPIWEPYALFKQLAGKKQARKGLQQGFLPQKGLTCLQRLALWLRANLFIPDPRCFWIKPSVNWLSKKLKNEPVELIISTGPPHSMHLIGCNLQQKCGLPWWADFRDCWTQWEMLLALHPSRPVLWLHRQLEQRVLRRCDLLMTVSKHWAKAFEAAGARRSFVLYNGYDPDDFNPAPPTPSLNKNAEQQAFRLLHLGNLNGRRSVFFLEAVAHCCKQSPAFASELQLQLGGVTDQALETHLRNDPVLATKTQWLGYLPHKNITHYYLNASVLLLFSHLSPSMNGQIPGKFFEYLAAQRPILALTPPEGELAELINAQQAGVAIAYNNTKAIANTLLQLHNHSLPAFRPLAPTKFSRKTQAQTLAHVLQTLPLQAPHAQQHNKKT